MAIEYKKQVAHLKDLIGAEEADTLFAWLQNTPKATLNLSKCTHLHAAVLQVLLFLQPSIVLPENTALADWLTPLVNAR